MGFTVAKFLSKFLGTKEVFLILLLGCLLEPSQQIHLNGEGNHSLATGNLV